MQPPDLPSAAERGREGGGTEFPSHVGDSHMSASGPSISSRERRRGGDPGFPLHVGDRHMSASGLSASSSREWRRGGFRASYRVSFSCGRQTHVSLRAFCQQQEQEVLLWWWWRAWVWSVGPEHYTGPGQSSLKYGHMSGLALRGCIRDRLMRVRTSFLRLVTSNKCTFFKGKASEDYVCKFFLNPLSSGF
jgi:hypothetical protein